MHHFRRYATDRQEEIISLLKAFVECESPSDSPAAVNRFVDLLIERSKHIAKAKVVRNRTSGNHVRLEFLLPGRKKSGQLLGLGHSDTVWPLGTLKHMR